MKKVKDAEKSAMFSKCYIGKPFYEKINVCNLRKNGTHKWETKSFYKFDDIIVLWVYTQDYDQIYGLKSEFYILETEI